MDADHHLRARKVNALNTAAAKLQQQASEGTDSEMNTALAGRLSARAGRIEAGEEDHSDFSPVTFDTPARLVADGGDSNVDL